MLILFRLYHCRCHCDEAKFSEDVFRQKEQKYFTALEKMHATTLALIALSQFLLIVEGADKSLDPLTEKAPVPRTGLLPAGTTSVSVFFQEGGSKTIDELKALALVALKEKKHIIDPGKYHCTVNVSLAAGDESGCTVIFSEGFGKPFYQVRFNKFGAIKEVYSSTLSEYSGRKITPLLETPR